MCKLKKNTFNCQRPRWPSYPLDENKLFSSNSTRTLIGTNLNSTSKLRPPNWTGIPQSIRTKVTITNGDCHNRSVYQQNTLITTT